MAEIKHWRGFRSIYVSEITVAPPISGLVVVEDAVWKIKADGRIVDRLTGELYLDQIREREATLESGPRCSNR